jgi:hypothetical protein
LSIVEGATFSRRFPAFGPRHATAPIDVDIEVFRFLERRRASFSQTHNDILRQIAGLSAVGAQPLRLVVAWRSKQGKPVSLDGWLYWECQLPGSNRWRGLRELRRKAS